MTDALRAEIRKLESADDFDAEAWMKLLQELYEAERLCGLADAWRRMMYSRARHYGTGPREFGPLEIAQAIEKEAQDLLIYGKSVTEVKKSPFLVRVINPASEEGREAIRRLGSERNLG